MENASAWYYHRGTLTPVYEHLDSNKAFHKGKVRLRYWKHWSLLCVKARSRGLCKSAIRAYLTSNHPLPDRLNIEYLGRFIDCKIQDWK